MLQPDAPMRLDDRAYAFLTSRPPRFGTLATINPDGTPHLAVIWYRVQSDGSILLNSRVGRRWPSNLLRDPRCSLAVEAGLEWVGVSGEVVVMPDHEQAYQDIASLARHYQQGTDEALQESLDTFRAQDRISFHLWPRGVTVHL